MASVRDSYAPIDDYAATVLPEEALASFPDRPPLVNVLACRGDRRPPDEVMTNGFLPSTASNLGFEHIHEHNSVMKPSRPKWWGCLRFGGGPTLASCRIEGQHTP